MKKNKLTKGFTLIELLVVIAIIGILGAIIYAPFQSARRKGRDSQKVIEMKNLVSTLTLYADSHGGYFPCTMTDLKDSLSDALPSSVNYTGTEDLTKYNYTAYASTSCTGAGASGFHLWTHLETNSGAIAGAAKCKGIISKNSSTGTSTCANFGSADLKPLPSSSGSVDEADATAKFLSSERIPSGTPVSAGDTDSVCATQANYCILDYHQ